MRRFSVAIPVLVTGICLYFVFVFGRDAIMIFSSPIWGLENNMFARAVYDIGRLADLGPGGLVQLAAFLGALKLAVAVVFALHLADRFRPSRETEINHELLDAGSLLAVCVTFIMAMPALLESTPQFLAPHRPALWLAGLAATLSMIERIAESEKFFRPATVPSAIVALPPRRGRTSALRWDYLRRNAGA
jgi:MFS family permease